MARLPFSRKGKNNAPPERALTKAPTSNPDPDMVAVGSPYGAVTTPESNRNGKPAVAGGDARNVQTGTSYEATRAALAQFPREIPDYEIGSALPLRIIDYVNELVSPITRAYVYNKMMNDAGVDSSVRIIKTPILGGDFFIEPYSDDKLDQLVSEFIEDNLFEGMSQPFSSTLEDILHFFEDGYSVIEKIYENREWAPSEKGANKKKYTMLKKLAVRPPSTIFEIDYDVNGGPVQVVQNAIRDGKTTEAVSMPIDKVMIFSYNKRGGDLYGRSILRTAYPHWVYKTHMYKIDAVQKERHGIGVPRGKLLPGAKQSDKDQLKTLLRNLRTNEESFIIETPTIEIDFAEIKSRPVNVIDSANHHNTMLFMNVLASFMTLGLSGTGGGRATAATQADLFMKSLRYVANYICQVVNMYLIPELVVWNFPTTNFPQLKARNIGETKDLQMLGAAIANLFAQGAVTGDPETENWIRQTFDMPSKLSTTGEPSPRHTEREPGTYEDLNGNGNGAGNSPSGGNGQRGDATGTYEGDGGYGATTASPSGSRRGAVVPGRVKSGNVGQSPTKST